MKAILFALCIVLQIQVFAEGCRGPVLKVGTFSGIMPLNPEIGTMYFPKYSSYTISIHGNMSCNYYVTFARVYLNNTLIVNNDTCYSMLVTFVLGAYPGKYRVEAKLDRISPHSYWNFEIADNPLGLIELSNNYAISVFPNPATAFINVSSEKEITALSLYSASGAMLAHFKPSSMSIQIPIEQYPPGIYFLNVAILGEQAVIKKIAIQ